MIKYYISLKDKLDKSFLEKDENIVIDMLSMWESGDYLYITNDEIGNYLNTIVVSKQLSSMPIELRLLTELNDDILSKDTLYEKEDIPREIIEYAIKILNHRYYEILGIIGKAKDGKL